MRPIARRRARAVFDLCAGFVYTQTLLALVQLDIPRALLSGALSAEELARQRDLPAARMERLLRAGVSLRLLRRSGRRFALGPLGAALIDNDGLEAMIAHHALLYGDLADPVALLRRGEGSLARFWTYAPDAPPDMAAPYTALMRRSQPMIAAEILAAYPVRDHRLLLDIGGGSGRFLTAALEQAPALRGIVFDLPTVATEAAAALQAAGLSRRARALGGDFLHDPLPGGADLVSLVRVLHDHDDANALRLLRRIRAVMPRGGTLLVAEPMAETTGAAPVGDAYFGWYLLSMGRGEPRSARRIEAMLRDSGFGSIQRRRTRIPMLAQIMIARVAE
ncbi:acetylserotonin O-methyltransferase [Acetobacteraceae bacterium KSS8]|uniref:Acetylserotonin O-methyltransferase n=1 Tax=Endosaccharibacter trunci TaxID=2812733 RepID=A0ABT1W6P6_9PROT|nr:acetylserotonin O-methyltransferase [Acetobacteraceae bacterium KSS8]